MSEDEEPEFCECGSQMLGHNSDNCEVGRFRIVQDRLAKHGIQPPGVSK